MTDSEANKIRLIAKEIMYRLYSSRQRSQLDLLRIYAVRALEEIDKCEQLTTPARPGEEEE